MPYAPTGSLNIGGTAGNAALRIGWTPDADRLIGLAGILPGLHGSLALAVQLRIALAGTLPSLRGHLGGVYDHNLLDLDFVESTTSWDAGAVLAQSRAEPVSDALPASCAAAAPWSEAVAGTTDGSSRWIDPERAAPTARSWWDSAAGLRIDARAGWRDLAFAARAVRSWWDSGLALERSIESRHRTADGLGLPPFVVRWETGAILRPDHLPRWSDGVPLRPVEVERWRKATYPGPWRRPKPIIPISPVEWGTLLRIACPLPGARLVIGRVPCPILPVLWVPERRVYMIENTASLVRWPDLTPLPVTAMTIETTFDSWCWGLSATLAGPDAWDLVQPNPLACEVLATINGQQWKFLLDVPNRSRRFNSDRVSLKGRSRSAWLHDPYAAHADFSETFAREMQQLGEAALVGTGWALDWRGENWVVPAGRYHSFNTPIGVLIRLANTTDDGLYTDPVDEIIALRKRWPVASWLIDGQAATLSVPDSAIVSLEQSPVYSQPLNGVYVSGTSHGALAFVKISGTDGALQPADPIVDELLCDEEGASARQRGLNALSDSGAGFEMIAETLFAPSASPAFPLVPPGNIVSIAGMKGVSRSCRITVTWSGGLQVRQTVGLERREVES